MRKKHFLLTLMGAVALLLLGAALAAMPGSAQATSAGYTSNEASPIQQLYDVDNAGGFAIKASVPLTTATPPRTPTSPPISPTMTPGGQPDLVGQMNWIGA